MSETRRQAAEKVKQNKMASAFEQLSATCTINPLDRGQTVGNPLAGAHSQSNKGVRFTTDGLLNPRRVDETKLANGEADNVTKLKQLLERVNQKREIIMKELMKPNSQSERLNFDSLFEGIGIPNGSLNREELLHGNGNVGSIGNCQFVGQNRTDARDSNVGVAQFERLLEKATQPMPRESQDITNDSPSKAGAHSKTSSVRKFQTAVWTHIDENSKKRDEQTNTSPVDRQNGTQRIFMHSQEVQTSMEYIGQDKQTEKSPNTIQEPHHVDNTNGSTWHEDLHEAIVTPGKKTNTIGSSDVNFESPQSSQMKTRKFVQQSEVTTIKAATSNTAPSQQYVYQVETTSSTTEIEVSSIEPVEDKRCRKKKYRHGSDGRKSSVAFPPSPIAKVKQVRKTLFNDNVEVIVNIKDDLLADVANIHCGEHNQGKYKTNTGELDISQDNRYGRSKRHMDPLENHKYKQCSYYPQATHCPRNCPCAVRKHSEHMVETQDRVGVPNSGQWQYCTRECQSARCHCVHDGNTTDETRSSYMSPPRYIRTLHEKEINNLISQHSLHGQVVSQAKFQEEKGRQEHESMHQRYPKEQMEELVKQHTHVEMSHVEQKQSEPFRQDLRNNLRHENVVKDKRVFTSEDTTVARDEGKANGKRHEIRERLKHVGQQNGYDQSSQRENHLNRGRDQNFEFGNGSHQMEQPKLPKKPVESVAPNNELMGYIVKLLNMDKKDISNIPIEVSDVSLESELFTSTSEASDNEPNARRYETLPASSNMTENVRTVGGLPRVENNARAEHMDRIDVNSRRNRNILAQNFNDIARTGRKNDKHSEAMEICTQLKTRHVNPTHEALGSDGFATKQPNIEFVKRLCNTQEPCYNPPPKHSGNYPPRKTVEIGPSGLGAAIANAGTKLPYKEIFKMNPPEPCAQSKYKAVPTHHRDNIAPAVPASNLQYHLSKKLEPTTHPCGNLQQTNLDFHQPTRPQQDGIKQSITKTLDQIRESKQIESPSRRRFKDRNQPSSGKSKQALKPISETHSRPLTTDTYDTRRKASKDQVKKDTQKAGTNLNKLGKSRKDHATVTQMQRQNISVQTTVPSGDESTVYLNIPRQFQNVDNVGVQEKLNTSLDTSDLKRGIQPQKVPCRNPEPAANWKSVRDICDAVGVEVSKTRTRTGRKDGKGYELKDIDETGVSDGIKGFGEISEGLKRRDASRLNGSMDLEVPDICLEHPLSQHNSGR